MGIADEIGRLEQLRASGALTDDEFGEAKRAVLDAARTPRSDPRADDGPAPRPCVPSIQSTC